MHYERGSSRDLPQPRGPNDLRHMFVVPFRINLEDSSSNLKTGENNDCPLDCNTPGVCQEGGACDCTNGVPQCNYEATPSGTSCVAASGAAGRCDGSANCVTCECCSSHLAFDLITNIEDQFWF